MNKDENNKIYKMEFDMNDKKSYEMSHTYLLHNYEANLKGRKGFRLQKA